MHVSKKGHWCGWKGCIVLTSYTASFIKHSTVIILTLKQLDISFLNLIKFPDVVHCEWDISV